MGCWGATVRGVGVLRWRAVLGGVPCVGVRPRYVGLQPRWGRAGLPCCGGVPRVGCDRAMLGCNRVGARWVGFACRVLACDRAMLGATVRRVAVLRWRAAWVQPLWGRAGLPRGSSVPRGCSGTPPTVPQANSG